jgi:hypothetical protein
MGKPIEPAVDVEPVRKHPLVVLDEILQGVIQSHTKRKAFIDAIADLTGSSIELPEDMKESNEHTR